MFFDFFQNLFQPFLSNPGQQPTQPQPDVNAFVSLFSGDQDGGMSWLGNAAREPPPWAPWSPGFESTPPAEREAQSIQYNLNYGIDMPYYKAAPVPIPPTPSSTPSDDSGDIGRPLNEMENQRLKAEFNPGDFPEDATEAPPPYAEPDFPEDATEAPRAEEPPPIATRTITESLKATYHNISPTDFRFEQAPIERTVGRPRRSPIKGAVIHYTHGTGDGLFYMSNSKKTGYNYYVHPDGKITQWAPDGIRMGHAGEGRDHSNNARPDLVNDNTLGIGLVTNRDGSGITEKQLRVAQGLVEKKAKEYGFTYKDVYGHGELTDPLYRARSEGMALVDRIRGTAQQRLAQLKATGPTEDLKTRGVTFGHPMALGKGTPPKMKTNVTAYSPVTDTSDKRIKMEGGVASSRKGPDGKAIVRTVEEYMNGDVPYVTLAGNPKFYGKKYTIPTLPVKIGGKTVTLKNVPAVVHDTGSAFRKAPEGRFDLALGIDLDDYTMAVNAGLWKAHGLQFVAVEDDD